MEILQEIASTAKHKDYLYKMLNDYLTINLWSSYKNCMFILWSSHRETYDHLTIILQSSYDHLTIILCLSYDHLTIILQASYKHLKIIWRSSYDHLTIILRSSYDHLTLNLQLSYTQLTNYPTTDSKHEPWNWVKETTQAAQNNKPGKPYWGGKLSIIDLFVLTILN